MKNKLNIIVAIVGVAYILFLIYSASSQFKRDSIISQNWCTHFDSAEINGIIKYVDKEPHNGDAFSVSNSPEEIYYATILFKEPYDDREFKRVATIGDSLIKRQFSDTLILIKDNLKYYCYFDKCKK